jgi:hypothetical protein
MNFAESIAQLRDQKELPPQQDIDFPEYRGLTFEDFWKALPHKLDYFDYEAELCDILEHPEQFPPEQRKHLWVKKATGLGITEFMIRYIAWKCLKDDEWRDRQVDVNVVIIVGPRIDLAITIMNRLKKLFGDHDFKSKETALILNSNRIEVFPSHHLAPARGLNPQFVFLDEADFFPPQMQQEARMVSERYIAKTDPYICMVSTPNLPLGLYDTMEREKNSIYVRKALGYIVGEGKVFTSEAIAKARRSPSFEREYNLQYGYGLGDIFQGLDEIIEKYDVAPTEYGRKCLCGDPAFGSSNFGICAGEVLDALLYVKEAKQYPRPSPSAMLDIMEDLAHNYNDNVKIDSAHPGFIRDLEERGIPALPVNFGLPVRDTENNTVQSLRSKMTINAAQMVKTGKVRIHPIFTDLIAQLRAAKFDDKGGVDKKELNFDIGDAFIMMCWDLKEFDYTSYGVTMDGNIIEEPKEKHSSLNIQTKVVE